MVKHSSREISTTMAIIISAVLVCGGILGYQYYSSRKTVNIPVTQNDHEKIARMLTQGYLEAYKFEDVVLSKRIKSYLINKIIIEIEEDNCFGFSVDFSVEVYKNDSDWVAGNGKIEENWVKNKNIFMNAVKNNNGYELKIVGTGRVSDDCTTGSPVTAVEVVK